MDYFRSVGAWTDAHDAHNKRLIARQAVLADAWERVADQQSADDFEARWMAVRAEQLTAAGFDPVWR